jgi:hypothetical protein
VSLVCGSGTEREKASVDIALGVAGPEVARGSVPRWRTEGIEYQLGRSLADRLVLAVKLLLSGVGVERRGRLVRNVRSINRGASLGRKRANMPKSEDKPFVIPKLLVWEAWRRVKANKGAPGVDGQDLEQFEAGLADNLYKIWNRMSSGSFFPPPVRAVEIPKPHGSGVRVLGVPTIADRVAQTVVAMHLEQRADHRFHPDSYGYRPNKSAHQALGACRQRCWKYDWVIDLDVQKFLVPSSHCLSVHGVVSNRACSACGTSIRRPFRRPLRTWIASSSPRFTRCNTVWRETPRARIASRIGM